jgi:hypothetical protein
MAARLGVAMRALHPRTNLVRYFWVAPCTAFGLCLAAPAFAFGATAQLVDGVIEVALSRSKPPNAFHRALPFNAITFGHLVIATTQAELDRLRVHERVHVRQYEQWGVFFLLAYPVASLWQLLRGRRAYKDNWFEVQAREEAAVYSVTGRDIGSKNVRGKLNR